MHNSSILQQVLATAGSCRHQQMDRPRAIPRNRPVPPEYRWAGNAREGRHSLTLVRQHCVAPPLSAYLLSSIICGHSSVVRILHGCFPPIVTCPDLKIKLADLDHRHSLSWRNRRAGRLLAFFPATSIHQPCCDDNCIQPLSEHQKKVPFPFYTHACTHSHKHNEWCSASHCSI